MSCIKCHHEVVSSLHMHYADWTNVIVQIFVPQFALNICIHRHLPLKALHNMGISFKAHWYNFGGCSLKYVKVHLRFAASSCTHTELFQQALN